MVVEVGLERGAIFEADGAGGRTVGACLDGLSVSALCTTLSTSVIRETISGPGG